MKLEQDHRRGRLDAARYGERRAGIDRSARARLRSPRRRRLGRRCVTPDFDRVDLVELSRQFGRRRAVSKVTLAAQARDILGLLGPERRRQVDAHRHARHAGRSDARARFDSAPPTASGDGAAVRAPNRAARTRAAPLPGADRPPEPDVLRQAVRPRCRAGSCPRRSKPPGSRSAPTTTCRRSREACASAWRSSGRCCTSRGCCCSTSRSPASTIAP